MTEMTKINSNILYSLLFFKMKEKTIESHTSNTNAKKKHIEQVIKI